MWGYFTFLNQLPDRRRPGWSEFSSGQMRCIKHIAETTQNLSLIHVTLWFSDKNGRVQSEQLPEQGVSVLASWRWRSPCNPPQLPGGQTVATKTNFASQDSHKSSRALQIADPESQVPSLKHIIFFWDQILGWESTWPTTWRNGCRPPERVLGTCRVWLYWGLQVSQSFRPKSSDK